MSHVINLYDDMVVVLIGTSEVLSSYNIVAGLAADSMLDIKSPSKRREVYSDETISFSEVDIITPAQKMLARQLTCDILPGESLLVTG